MSLIALVIVIIKHSQGVPPVSLAEWTLQGDGGRDFYDGLSTVFIAPDEILHIDTLCSLSC